MSRKLVRTDYAGWAEYYSAYQEKLAREHILPFLSRAGISIDGCSVLDIGCGDGGATRVFAEKARSTLGTDIEKFDWVDAEELHFEMADVLDEEWVSSVDRSFDLVVLRDVIEHIDDKRRLMDHIDRVIVPGGRLLVTFPPYYSAFGGHQQVYLKGSFLRLVPWVHCHPKLRELWRGRMTIGGFERLMRASGYRVLGRELYLLRPSFELRYGTPTVRMRLPWLRGMRELLCTGAYYLAVKE
ncbi:class I SAM-dependent methyltransferase [bacterium]|nr:class I SAM-dependent methyltransferase [bacterium]